MKFISDNFRDSTDRDFFVNVLSDYYRIKKNLGKFINERPKLLSDVEYSYEQLSSLRKDLNARVLDKKTFESYLIQETDAVQSLYQRVNELVDLINTQVPKFDDLYKEVHLKIDPLIEEQAK